MEIFRISGTPINLPSFSVPPLLFHSMSLKQRKVARLLKYLQFRDYKSKLLKAVEEEETQQDTGINSLIQQILYTPGTHP